MHQPANAESGDHRIDPREVPRDRAPTRLPLYFAPALRLLFREFEGSAGHSRGVTSPPPGGLVISGSKVGVIIKVAFPPAMGGFYLNDLRADGLRVFRTVPAHGLVEGMLPIAKLPALTPLVAHVLPFHGVIPARHASK
jgi:hypothetical protein